MDKNRFYKFKQLLRDVWAIAAFSVSCLRKLSAIKLNWLNIYAGMLSVTLLGIARQYCFAIALGRLYCFFFYYRTDAPYEVVRETKTISPRQVVIRTVTQ